MMQRIWGQWDLEAARAAAGDRGRPGRVWCIGKAREKWLVKMGSWGHWACFQVMRRRQYWRKSPWAHCRVTGWLDKGEVGWELLIDTSTSSVWGILCFDNLLCGVFYQLIKWGKTAHSLELWSAEEGVDTAKQHKQHGQQEPAQSFFGCDYGMVDLTDRECPVVFRKSKLETHGLGGFPAQHCFWDPHSKSMQRSRQNPSAWLQQAKAGMTCPFILWKCVTLGLCLTQFESNCNAHKEKWKMQDRVAPEEPKSDSCEGTRWHSAFEGHSRHRQSVPTSHHKNYLGSSSPVKFVQLHSPALTGWASPSPATVCWLTPHVSNPQELSSRL